MKLSRQPRVSRSAGVPLAILTYHSLDETGSPVSIQPRTFAQHLGRLRRAGYTVLPLGEALTLHAAPTPGPSPRRLAALTFDDGYASVYSIAAPLLANFGWRATIFAVSDYLGSDNQWPGQPDYVPPTPLLTWPQVETLAANGWEIGGHTHTHPDLTTLQSEGHVEDEVLGGKRQLEARLGRSIDLFAYPYGRYDDRVRSVVRQHFRAACTTQMGWASRSSALDALERLEMWDFARPGTARLVASPFMGAYVAVARGVRKRKSR